MTEQREFTVGDRVVINIPGALYPYSHGTVIRDSGTPCQYGVTIDRTGHTIGFHAWELVPESEWDAWENTA